MATKDAPTPSQPLVLSREQRIAQLNELTRVEKARAWLENYGIDTEKMDDATVLQKVEIIKEATELKSEVLSRGRVLDSLDRLLGKVQPGFVGEFKRNNHTDIQLAEAMGWKVLIDSKLAKESDTPSADGRVILGDLILMVIPDTDYVAIKLAERRRRAKKREAHSAAAQIKEAAKQGITISEFP